jgi:hypothetical protein
MAISAFVISSSELALPVAHNIFPKISSAVLASVIH